jgi:L-asparaginase II
LPSGICAVRSATTPLGNLPVSEIGFASGSVPLVEVSRGPFVECVHSGHAVVADAGGIVAAWGEPGAVILPRSSCKMLQALPLVESGAADAAGLGAEALALACASHSGAAAHVERVERWLEALGLGEEALRCGAQVPGDRVERQRLRAQGRDPGQVHNNCSGKHAGFLTLGAHLRAGPEYVEPDHPVQRAVRAAFEEMTGQTSPGWGIDGCSAPNFGCTIGGLAQAAARMARPQALGRARGAAAERLVAAMIAHPLLVAGEGRACTELMAAAQGRAAIKTGAEGVFLAILPERGLGVALKVADGATRASEAAVAAILVRLGVLEAGDPAVEARLRPAVLSRRGAQAGEIRPAASFWESGCRL